MPARATSKAFFVETARHLSNLCPGDRASCTCRAFALDFTIRKTGPRHRPGSPHITPWVHRVLHHHPGPRGVRASPLICSKFP